MQRINMKQVTVEVLQSIKEIKKITTDYPSTWNTFPIAVYKTAFEPHQIEANGDELQTKWIITIELYGTTSQTNIANNVLTTFGDIGFFGKTTDANTADLKRTIVELSAVVDNVTRHVFKN